MLGCVIETAALVCVFSRVIACPNTSSDGGARVGSGFVLVALLLLHPIAVACAQQTFLTLLAIIALYSVIYLYPALTLAQMPCLEGMCARARGVVGDCSQAAWPISFVF